MKAGCEFWLFWGKYSLYFRPLEWSVGDFEDSLWAERRRGPFTLLITKDWRE